MKLTPAAITLEGSPSRPAAFPAKKNSENSPAAAAQTMEINAAGAVARFQKSPITRGEKYHSGVEQSAQIHHIDDIAHQHGHRQRQDADDHRYNPNGPKRALLAGLILLEEGLVEIIDKQGGRRQQHGVRRRHGGGEDAAQNQARDAGGHIGFNQQGIAQVRVVQTGQKNHDADAQHRHRQPVEKIGHAGEDKGKAGGRLVPGRENPLNVMLVGGVGKEAEQAPGQHRGAVNILKG